MNMIEEVNGEKLIADLKTIVADAESILSTTASHTGEKVTELRASLLKRLNETKVRLLAAEEAVMGKARQAAAATDQYVHENPWQSVAIAGGIGLLIGYLASRRN